MGEGGVEVGGAGIGYCSVWVVWCGPGRNRDPRFPSPPPEGGVTNRGLIGRAHTKSLAGPACSRPPPPSSDPPLPLPRCQAYNKRATVHYLTGQYDNSIQDCKLVLQMQVGGPL